MLRFNKLAVPGDFTDNVKDIRRLPQRFSGNSRLLPD
jgi:hypothetical protein